MTNTYEDEKALRKALEEAERQRYRAVCKVRCLESGLDRIEYEQFDEVMAMLEEAKAELQRLGSLCFDIRYRMAVARFNQDKTTQA